jgi:hypothetical protein
VDVGILSHQILDSLWTDPSTWLYPALGTSPVHTPAQSDFLLYLLETDLFNPVEWILILFCISGAILYWQRDTLVSLAKGHVRTTGIVLKCAEAILCVLCGVVVFCAFLKIPLKDLAVTSADQYVMCVGILALAAILFYHWELRLYGRRPVRKQGSAKGCVYSTPPGPASRILLRMDNLVRAFGAEPAWVSFAAAVEMATAHGILSDPSAEQSLLPMARIFLGIILLTVGAGVILLLAGNRMVPGGILVIGLASAGLFFGCILGSQKHT